MSRQFPWAKFKLSILDKLQKCNLLGKELEYFIVKGKQIYRIFPIIAFGNARIIEWKFNNMLHILLKVKLNIIK